MQWQMCKGRSVWEQIRWQFGELQKRIVNRSYKEKLQMGAIKRNCKWELWKKTTNGGYKEGRVLRTVEEKRSNVY